MKHQRMYEKHLILAGGGHSHLAVLRDFARKPLPGMKLTLISPDKFTAYSGALSAWMANQISEDRLYINLENLARRAGARLVTGKLVQIHPDDKTLTLGNGEMLEWELLSLNTGSTPSLSQLPGAENHAIPVKPIENFVAAWKELLRTIHVNPQEERHIAFIGAGVAGCELALTAANALRRVANGSGVRDKTIHIHLLSDNTEPAPTMNAGFREKLAIAMMSAGVHFHPSVSVTEISREGIQTTRDFIPADTCFITTQASAPSWAVESALETDLHGFILVNNYLQSLSHPSVFAAGDIATMKDQPVAKSGVYAVRQGPVLNINLRRSIANQTLQPCHLQKHTLALLHTGLDSAIAGRAHWSAQGWFWWKLKHYLDRQFVNRYR